MVTFGFGKTDFVLPIRGVHANKILGHNTKSGKPKSDKQVELRPGSAGTSGSFKPGTTIAIYTSKNPSGDQPEHSQKISGIAKVAAAIFGSPAKIWKALGKFTGSTKKEFEADYKDKDTVTGIVLKDIHQFKPEAQKIINDGIGQPGWLIHESKKNEKLQAVPQSYSKINGSLGAKLTKIAANESNLIKVTDQTAPTKLVKAATESGLEYKK